MYGTKFIGPEFVLEAVNICRHGNCMTLWELDV